MPEFRDTRKVKQAPIYNGWTDEREPRSPVAELFAKLVPLMQGLKKSRHGSFVFPPKPPHPELGVPPAVCYLPREEECMWRRPDLSDFGCSKRCLKGVRPDEITALAAAVK